MEHFRQTETSWIPKKFIYSHVHLNKMWHEAICCQSDVSLARSSILCSFQCAYIFVHNYFTIAHISNVGRCGIIQCRRKTHIHIQIVRDTNYNNIHLERNLMTGKAKVNTKIHFTRLKLIHFEHNHINTIRLRVWEREKTLNHLVIWWQRCRMSD